MNLQSLTNTMKSTSTSNENEGIVTKCFYFEPENIAVFDLHKVKHNYNLSQLTNLTDLIPTPLNENEGITFTFCADLPNCTDTVTKASNKTHFMYQFINPETNQLECIRYGGSYENNKWSVNTWNISEGIKIKLSDGTEGYIMTLIGKCNRTVLDLHVISNNFDPLQPLTEP